MKHKQKTLFKLFSASLIFLVGLVLLFLMVMVFQPYQGHHQQTVILRIARGSTTNGIARLLETHGIVFSGAIFELYARFLNPGPLQAGEYRFQGSVSIPFVVNKLQRGLVIYHRVLVPEGLNMDEIVERLVQENFGTPQQFFRQLEDISLVSDIDPLAKNLEGYLFPDTYFVTHQTEEQQIIRAMVRNFRNVWTSQRLERARQLKLTTREVLTLASLIEKETGIPAERPIVSAVFHNRLRSNLKLQCDPTVIYALKLTAEYDGIIHQSDLRLDSPYNTYLYAGLPPGPIASPGLASIEAALYPANVTYLYFVAKDNGGHFFSTNYGEHRRAVRQYQR